MKYALLSMPLLLTLVMSSNVTAQRETRSAAIYQCGKEGKELRDSPCPEAPSKAASTVLYDQPGAAEQEAARQVALADARQARALESERLAAEAQARRDNARAAALNAPPAAASAPEQAHHRPPKPHRPRKPPRPPKAASAPR
jgi:hypothetical protein